MFNGTTRNPQHGTIAAVITALGDREEFVKDHKIETERAAAAAWLEKQDKKPQRQPKKKRAANGTERKVACQQGA